MWLRVTLEYISRFTVTSTGCVPPSNNNVFTVMSDVPVKYRPKLAGLSVKQLLITLFIEDVSDFLHITWVNTLLDTGSVIPREGDSATGSEAVIFITHREYRTLRSLRKDLAPRVDVNNITPRSGHFILDVSPTVVVYARARSILYKLRTPLFAENCVLGSRVWQPPAQCAVVTGGTPTEISLPIP